MTKQTLIVEVTHGRRTAVVFGPAWAAREILKTIDAPCQYDAARRGVLFPADRSDDFLAAAELWTNLSVRLEEVVL